MVAGAGPLSPDRVLALQRSAGNAAVNRMLHRQLHGGAAVAPPGPAPAAGAAAVPPMEFVSSSTQLESTRDIFTERIVALMRARGLTFVAAAREVARRDLTGGGEHATRSGDLRQAGARDPAPARQAIAFAVSDYQGREANLPTVAQHLGPGGIARRALRDDYGAANAAVMTNPTAAQIDRGVALGIENVARLARERGGRGELTLFFDGHGSNRGMEGADGAMFTLEALRAHNVRAIRSNVQLIVVSNACFQGAGVLLAEEMASMALNARIDLAGLSPRRDTRLRAAVRQADELIQFGQVLNRILEQVGRVFDHEDHSPARAVLDHLRLQLAFLDAFDRHVERGFAAASVELNRRIRRVWDRLHAARSTGDTALLVAVRPDLNWISNHLLEEVAQLQEWVQMDLDLAAL